MKFLEEFKTFAMKGNVVDLAIGIVIGTAFGKIVTSFVNDILTPPLGVLMGGLDFSNLFINLSSKSVESLAQAKAVGAATLNYGVFINTLIDFTIVAFALFIVVKQLNRLKKAPVVEEVTVKDCPYCYSSIPLKATRCGHCTSELN